MISFSITDNLTLYLSLKKKANHISNRTSLVSLITMLIEEKLLACC